MFSKKRVIYVNTLEEMNEHLNYCLENTTVHDCSKKNKTFGHSGLNSFIEDRMVKLTLTYKKDGYTASYVFFKDGRLGSQVTDGGEAFRILSRYYKVPKFENIYGSASPLLYKNKKYEGTRQRAWGYDLNSAYSYGMIQLMPDTSKGYRSGTIKKGKEIGFLEREDEDGGMSLVPLYEGLSNFIFPLMESPFKKFVGTWFTKKLNPKTKAKAKGVLNYSVGYLQRVNPFIRATIIGHCNNYIASLIDEDTLYCNTDSLVSKRERTDLDIGKGLGQWKVEHDGYFAFIGFNYQWDLSCPSYRGKPKSWFDKEWDILKDKIPNDGNFYEFDMKKFKIIERVK